MFNVIYYDYILCNSIIKLKFKDQYMYKEPKVFVRINKK